MVRKEERDKARSERMYRCYRERKETKLEVEGCIDATERGKRGKRQSQEWKDNQGRSHEIRKDPAKEQHDLMVLDFHVICCVHKEPEEQSEKQGEG